MELTFEQIKSVIHGAARIFEQDGAVVALRLTEEQTEFYSFKKDMYEKSAATAGVHLDFMTDSRKLKIVFDACHADGVSYFSHNIYIDGAHALSIENDLNQTSEQHMTVTATLSMKGTEKRVSVYMPWTACSKIVSVELDDGATLTPVVHKRKMIMYGDSITHGSWAKDASSLYTTRLCHMLDADGINKGLGGDVMRKGFSAIADSLQPDIVTVAYGTNDWSSKHSAEEVFDDSKQFYSDLSANYPNAKIFVISPIWRGNADIIKATGSLESHRENLRRAAEGLPNVIFINAFDFVPHEPQMYIEDMLHPSDLGFEHYAKKLFAAITPYLG